MESLNALLQGMGLMHLGAGQAIMLLVSLLLLWLAIAKKFEPLLLLPIGFGGLLSNIPEAGMALTALESLLAHHDAGQLAVIAAKLNCAPDVHAIKEALALALPSVQSQMENLAVDMGYTEAGMALTALESLLAHHDAGQLAVIAAKLNCAPDVHAIKEALALALPSVQSQMENLAVDMGYTPGVLALFYKVAIGSGVAPLVIFMGVGAMTDFGPLLANRRRDDRLRPAAGQPAHPAAGGGGAVRYLRHGAGGADAELLRPDFLHPAAGGGHRHHRRRGRPNGDLSVGQAGAGAAGGHRGGGVLVYGAGAVNPAADYESADHGDGAENPHGAAAHGE
ncbi:oxaloacetate decarboxylase beta chain [Salmonella enterica subsp. enterica serovar Agona str. 70.E.05]|nr:oxaloacetate decarboxylase beta chain [Salmonella enterica subsp. enterica serovar Agona str. 70.E.05]